MIIFSFKIDDMTVQRQYRVDLNMSVCFESSGSCLYEVALFTNAVVPKILCNWQSDFSIPGKTLRLKRLDFNAMHYFFMKGH